MRYNRYEQKLLRDCFCGPGREKETKKMLERYSYEAARLRVGDTMYLGRFRVPDGGKPMDAAGAVMNILWRVLERSGDELLLISEYVLDWEMFDDCKTRFDESFLHMLLEGEYLPEWFTPEERSLLRGEPDKLTLMTIDDAKKYFPEPRNARAFMPMAEISRDDEGGELFRVTREPNEWWLSTPGTQRRSVAYVNRWGEIDEGGIECSADEIGVRPMIRIDLSGIKDLQ